MLHFETFHFGIGIVLLYYVEIKNQTKLLSNYLFQRAQMAVEETSGYQ